eukprot:8868182-Pyramimonas_sp.AAC.1
MMAMFEIPDSESDASDLLRQSPEEDDCNDIADAAAAKSDENELMPLMAQPVKEPAAGRNEWNGERLVLECCCGSNSKIELR